MAKRKLTPREVAGMLRNRPLRMSPLELRQFLEGQRIEDDEDLLDEDDCPEFDDMDDGE